LSAGFENISYVLAFDDEIVANALGEKYGAGGVGAGRDFLEKIVQAPLHLPPADRLALRQVLFEGIDATLSQVELTLAQDNAKDFVRSFQDGLEIRLKTPRQANRYANALAFGIPILKGEVHPVDQMLIEGMRVFYPALYETEDASEIGGCSGKLFQRRTQKGRCAHRRKGRQQHRVLVAVFVHAQRLAQAGESGRRRPHWSPSMRHPPRKENAATGLVSGRCASR